MDFSLNLWGHTACPLIRSASPSIYFACCVCSAAEDLHGRVLLENGGMVCGEKRSSELRADP